jgi:hypothetical protein
MAGPHADGDHLSDRWQEQDLEEKPVWVAVQANAWAYAFGSMLA